MAERGRKSTEIYRLAPGRSSFHTTWVESRPSSRLINILCLAPTPELLGIAFWLGRHHTPGPVLNCAPQSWRLPPSANAGSQLVLVQLLRLLVLPPGLLVVIAVAGGNGGRI